MVQSIAIYHCYRSLVYDFSVGNVGGLDTREIRVFWGRKYRVYSIFLSVVSVSFHENIFSQDR